MNPNTKEINIEGTKYILVDLTQKLRLDTEVFPGDPKPQRKVFSSIESGYEHYTHSIGDHNFTPHGDAPKHQNPDSQEKGFDCWGIDRVFNQAYLINLDGKVEIRKEDLEPHAGKIATASALILRTGYDRHLEENRPHIPEKIPYLNAEAADLIANFKNLKVLGIDSITVDPMGIHHAHQALSHLLIVESLVHLHEIPSNEFSLQTSPVKIEGATGGPVVAFAYIKA
jgi:kynurenine formamidase